MRPLIGTYLSELNRESRVGYGGELVDAYADLLRQMWSGENRVVTPTTLKDVVGKHAPRFQGCVHLLHSHATLLYYVLLPPREYYGALPPTELPLATLTRSWQACASFTVLHSVHLCCTPSHSDLTCYAPYHCMRCTLLHSHFLVSSNLIFSSFALSVLLCNTVF